MVATLKFLKNLQQPSGTIGQVKLLITDNRDTVISDMMDIIKNLLAYLPQPLSLNHIYAINMDTGDDINLIDGLYVPGKVLIDEAASLNFTTLPINTFEEMPIKIKIIDKKNIIDSENINITIEACNNFFDDIPIWEDITNEYNNGDFYIFTNLLKTAANWGISIRVTAVKLVPTAEIEISDLIVGYV